MDFRNRFWSAIEPQFEAILRHPFLKGLADGTLPEECFRFYVLQDSFYLRDFSRALALLGSRAPDPASTSMFSSHAANAVAVEQALHEGFFEGWERNPAWRKQREEVTEPSPTCLLYTSFLLRVVGERPFAEGLAAVLPCYWIYREVGRHLGGANPPNELYRRWIDTYGGDAFDEVVEEVLALAERAFSALTDVQLASALEHFKRAALLEYMFWDSAWKLERWPDVGARINP